MPSWPFQGEKTSSMPLLLALASNVLSSSATSAYGGDLTTAYDSLLSSSQPESPESSPPLFSQPECRVCASLAASSHVKLISGPKKNTNTYRFDAIAVRFHVEPGQSWASVFMPVRHKFGFYAVYGRTKGNLH